MQRGGARPLLLRTIRCPCAVTGTAEQAFGATLKGGNRSFGVREALRTLCASEVKVGRCT